MIDDSTGGQWKQPGGKPESRWGKPVNGDPTVAEETEYPAGRLRERYGIARDQPERQARDLEA